MLRRFIDPSIAMVSIGTVDPFDAELLHASLHHCITACARLSGTDDEISAVRVQLVLSGHSEAMCNMCTGLRLDCWSVQHGAMVTGSL